MSARAISKASIANLRNVVTAVTTVPIVRRLSMACSATSRDAPSRSRVFEGNTADPMTLAAQITKLRTRFNLSRIVLVGDRGLITDARLEVDVKPAGLDWITALRAPAIRELAAECGPLQLSLFDQRDMAEITGEAGGSEAGGVFGEAASSSACRRTLSSPYGVLSNYNGKHQMKRRYLAGIRSSYGYGENTWRI
jgi:hypothetical protein